MALTAAAMAVCGLTPLAAAGADQFLRSLQQEAQEQLGDTSASRESREQRFRELFNENFDVPAIGAFVLGRYWRTATPEEQQGFLDAFQAVMAQRFLPLLSEHSEVTFEIGTPQQDRQDAGLILLPTKILRPSGEPYSVVWKIREKGGKYRIVDIVAQNISMAITLRSEYGSAIKQAGGNVSSLTRELRQKVARGAYVPQT